MRSRILNGAERICGRVRDLFGRSLILQTLASLYPRMEQAFRRGRFEKMSDAESDRQAWQYRFRHAFMQTLERSWFYRAYESLTSFLMQTSISTYAAFGILYGTFSAAIVIADTGSVRGLSSLIASLVLSVVSVPLLHSSKSLGHGIAHSLFLGGLLFGFCGLSETRFEECERGKDRYWAALWTAFLCGMGSMYLPAVWLLIGLVCLLIFWLLFAAPELCAVTLLFLLPFLNLTEHPTVFLSAGVFLCLVSWLCKAFCGRRELRFGLLDLTVLLFSLLFLCGGLIGAGTVYTGVTMFLLLLFWFPMRNLFSREKWRGRAITALKLSGGMVAGIGVYQYFFGGLELRWVDTARFADIGGRVCATFTNPNILAVYLLSVTPLFLAGVADEMCAWSRRILDCIGFAVCVGCLVVTWSRGAWLGILLATLLFLLCYSRRTAGLLLLAPLFAVAAMPFLPHNIVNRFSSIGSFSESSIRYRFYTWQGVWRLLRTHRWGIGVGSEAFYAVYPHYAVSGTESVMHTHQLFLQILTELGIPGLAVFLFFLTLLILCVAHGLQSLHGHARAEMLGCVCSVLGVGVMGMFDYVWYHAGMFCLFFTLCAMLTLPAAEERSL